MISSDQCESCGITPYGSLCGEVLAEHREHNICAWCQTRWQRDELRLRRLIEFEEFKGGLKSKIDLSKG
jgi:hypothetical protein